MNVVIPLVSKFCKLLRCSTVPTTVQNCCSSQSHTSCFSSFLYRNQHCIEAGLMEWNVVVPTQLETGVKSDVVTSPVRQ